MADKSGGFDSDKRIEAARYRQQRTILFVALALAVMAVVL